MRGNSYPEAGVNSSNNSRQVVNVDLSKIVRLPVTDLPSFVGFVVMVPVALFIAKKLPVLNKLT